MIPSDVLRQIAAHASAAYPAECCGLLLEDRTGGLRFQPVRNVAGTSEGSASARTQRDGYVMDPGEQLRAVEAAEEAGGRLWGIVHSHPDVGAYFSSEDKDKALIDSREPWYPGVFYLVVSVRAGRVDGACLYRWDEGRKDFLEEQVAGITSLS